MDGDGRQIPTRAQTGQPDHESSRRRPHPHDGPGRHPTAAATLRFDGLHSAAAYQTPVASSDVTQPVQTAVPSSRSQLAEHIEPCTPARGSTEDHEFDLAGVARGAQLRRVAALSANVV